MICSEGFSFVETRECTGNVRPAGAVAATMVQLKPWGDESEMDVEQEVLAIVRMKVPPGTEIDMNTKLSDAGLDSLDVIELAYDAEYKFHIELPPLAAGLSLMCEDAHCE
jgi:acyl carrier protein